MSSSEVIVKEDKNKIFVSTQGEMDKKVLEDDWLGINGALLIESMINRLVDALNERIVDGKIFIDIPELLNKLRLGKQKFSYKVDKVKNTGIIILTDDLSESQKERGIGGSCTLSIEVTL